MYPNSDVGLTFEMDFRTLAGQSLNGVPVIANREYKGSITLVDGEPAVVAGSVSQSEQLSLTGIPGLGVVPGINKIMTTNSKMDETDELLVVITPHWAASVNAGQSGCDRAISIPMAVMQILIAMVMRAEASGPRSCRARTLSSMKERPAVMLRMKNRIPLPATSRMDAERTRATFVDEVPVAAKTDA